MYWTGENKPKGPARYYWYYRSSADVEMTAYALLAILLEGRHNSVVTDEVMDIIRWLSKQRNSYGGFASTQVSSATFYSAVLILLCDEYQFGSYTARFLRTLQFPAVVTMQVQ